MCADSAGDSRMKERGDSSPLCFLRAALQVRRCMRLPDRVRLIRMISFFRPVLAFRFAGQRAPLLAGLFRFQQFRARADLQDRRCMGLPDRVQLAG